MISSNEIPPPYEDKVANIAKELEEARKMIEMLTSDKKRDEEKERNKELEEARKKQLKEYVQAFEKRTIMDPYTCGRGRNSNYWEYLDKLDETYILLNKTGRLLLTDKNLYMTKFVYGQDIHHPHMGKIQLEFRPLYTFDKPLTIDELNIFKNKEFERWFFASTFDSNHGVLDIQNLKSLEHMITIIPGSYKNKGWRNIGGFTGVYINDMKGLFAGNPLLPPEREL